MRFTKHFINIVQLKKTAFVFVLLAVVFACTNTSKKQAEGNNLQKDIQENVYGYDFEKMRNDSLVEFRKFFDWNYHAIQDELREVFDALGGIHDGVQSGVWKPWKKRHEETKSVFTPTPMVFNDLSDRDVIELKMELIDELHFLFNKMHAAGMTTEELFNYYFAKNKENRERQKNNY